MKTISVCEVCLQSYILNEEEVVIPSNMRIKRKKPSLYLETWVDWVMHVQSHCPMCRQDQPDRVLEDLQTHTQAQKADRNTLN